MKKALTYVEVIADDHHGRVAARALALNLDDGELAVLGSVPGLDATELGADGVQDVVRATKHARRRCANLDKVLSNGFTVHTSQYTCVFYVCPMLGVRWSSARKRTG